MESRSRASAWQHSVLLYVVVALICLSVTCVAPDGERCGTSSCPVTATCVAATTTCVPTSNLQACQDLAEGAMCTLAGAVGTCQTGVCTLGTCGDAQLDAGEQCDDGNRTSGDGCRADCRKNEVCGDGITDANEQCDDANSIAIDGCDACRRAPWQARAMLGSTGAALDTAFSNMHVTVGLDDEIYVAESATQRIFRLGTDGSLQLIAGNGEAAAPVEGRHATTSPVQQRAIAANGLGEVFFNDATTHKIYKANRDGRIETVAGNGSVGNAIVGAAALASQLGQIEHLSFAPNGLLYFFEPNSKRVLRINHEGTIEQVAILSCDTESECTFTFPLALAVDREGQAYLATIDIEQTTLPGTNLPTFEVAVRLRRSEAGTLPIVCGRVRVPIAELANLPPPPDGSDCATTALSAIYGLTLDSADHLLLTVGPWHQVFRIDDAGRIFRIAGSTQGAPAGDEGPALAATLRDPTEIRATADNSLLFVDDSGRRLRRIDPQGQIHAVAGNGGQSPPRSARSHTIQAGDLAVLANGDMMLTNASTRRILRIAADSTLTDATSTASNASELGTTAASLTLRDPEAIVAQGNDYFFTDSTLGKVFHVHADQSVTVVAGTGKLANGSLVSDGDNGPAQSASLHPQALTVDARGNVFVHDNAGASIRKITPDGVITRVVGSGTGVHQATVSNQPATAAFLNSDNISLVVDPQGRLVFSDGGRIWRIEADGMLRTIAGTGVSGYTGDGGAALSARLNAYRIAYGPDGALYLAERSNHVIRRIDLSGIITTVAGTGVAGNSGDQGPARSAKLYAPNSLAFDDQGRLLLIDGNNQRLRRINGDGTIESIAGRLQPANLGPLQQSAVAGAAALAFMKAPGAPADAAPSFIDDGNVLLAATGTAAGVLRVGDAEVTYIAGRYPQENDVGNRARYRAQSFGAVSGIVWDAARQRAYISEAGTTAVGKHRLWSLTASTTQDADTWTMAPLANESGAPGRRDGAASAAQLQQPGGLYLDTTEDALYIADTGNHAIRRLALATMTITTIVNANGRYGYAGDGGAARDALLYQPRAVTRCPNGDLIISDTGNHRVRRVEQATQRITTLLGDGTPASSGQGRPATNFPVDTPVGLVCDAVNNVFVTSRTTVRALPASETGIVDGTGPVLTIFGATPGLDTLAVQATCLSGIVEVAPSTMLVADECTGVLIELRR